MNKIRPLPNPGLPPPPSETPLMCRNIKTLFNYDPPATEAEVEASALQYVRKLSGFRSPSKSNEDAFNLAVEQVKQATLTLLSTLETQASPRNREIEAAKARERNRQRFGA
jgi:hypothetical protein